MFVTVCPKNAENILGGASWPPSRSSFPGTQIADRYNYWFDRTALSLIRAKSKNNSSL